MMKFGANVVFPKTRNSFEAALCRTKMANSLFERARYSHHGGVLGSVPSLLAGMLWSIMWPRLDHWTLYSPQSRLKLLLRDEASDQFVLWHRWAWAPHESFKTLKSRGFKYRKTIQGFEETRSRPLRSKDQEQRDQATESQKIIKKWYFLNCDKSYTNRKRI